MLKKHRKMTAVLILLGVVLCVMAYAAKTGESERKITKADVPAAALASLEKLAAGAEITEFAEEVEYGETFYEGSWKTRSGANMDVLVTSTGDLMEIEEQVDADNVPAAVLKAAIEAAGKGTQLEFEKKTTIFYEVKFQKDGGQHELLLTPDARLNKEDVEKGESDDDDGEVKVSIDDQIVDIPYNEIAKARLADNIPK